MHGIRLSNEKIQTKQKGPQKSSDNICSLQFVDRIPTKANSLPTMHMGNDTKRRKTRDPLFKYLLLANKTRAE